MSDQAQVSVRYDDQSGLLPELDLLGYDKNPKAVRRLSGHIHRRAYEICYISKGQVDWWAGPEVYRVNKGDVYITRPGELHGGVDAMMHTSQLYFLLITLPKRGELPGLDRAQTRALAEGYGKLQHRCFASSSRVQSCFEKIFEAHSQGGPLAVVVARAALHELLVTVLHDHDAAFAQRGGRLSDKSPAMLRAMRWIDDHLVEDVAVADVAQAVGLSVSRFHERFLEEVGFSPNDYRTRRRVEIAKQRLRSSEQPITAIAMQMGFSTSQYFATVFRRHTGISPRAYRAMSHEETP